MAFADEAFLLAPCQQGEQALVAAFGPGFQGFQLLQVGLVVEQGTDLLEVLPDRHHHRFRGAQGVVDGDLRGGQVEAGDLPGQGIDMGGRQFTAGLQGAEQVVLGELAHLQHILECRTFASDLRRLGGAGDRQHFEVEVVGQALIQAQLFATEMLAGVEAGEVEEAEVDRLLDLVGIAAGQQHPGYVRLDHLEPVHRMGVKGGILQGGYQGLAHGRSLFYCAIGARHYGLWAPGCKPSGRACWLWIKCV
ncbi:hypothetical protein D3C80_1005730 [compost metagenome]